MENFSLEKIMAVVLTLWVIVKRWIDIIVKITDPLIRDVEQMALDGTIDRKDRKAVVMKALALLEERGSIKLNFVTRLVIGRVVDDLARNLPDFKVNAEASGVLSDIVRGRV